MPWLQKMSQICEIKVTSLESGEGRGREPHVPHGSFLAACIVQALGNFLRCFVQRRVNEVSSLSGSSFYRRILAAFCELLCGILPPLPRPLLSPTFLKGEYLNSLISVLFHTKRKSTEYHFAMLCAIFIMN